MCNCSASVKSIGTTTFIKLMKQGEAFLQSLRDTEHLQIMKSGILQSGMYDAFQHTYSIQYTCTMYNIQCVCVQEFTTVRSHGIWALLSSVFNLVSVSAYEINMKFVIDQLIHNRYVPLSDTLNVYCHFLLLLPPTHTLYSPLTGPTS